MCMWTWFRQDAETWPWVWCCNVWDIWESWGRVSVFCMWKECKHFVPRRWTVPTSSRTLVNSRGGADVNSPWIWTKIEYSRGISCDSDKNSCSFCQSFLGHLLWKTISHHIKNPATLRPPCRESRWRNHREREEMPRSPNCSDSDCLSLSSPSTSYTSDEIFKITLWLSPDTVQLRLHKKSKSGENWLAEPTQVLDSWTK